MNDNKGGSLLRKADPNTIQDKFLVGYQGWFTCRGDGAPVHAGHHGWLHWVDRPIPEGGRPNIDFWPDVSAYSPSELFPVPGLTLHGGQPACVFSSRHPRTVRRHFHWMAEHGVDGCFLQRFVSQIETDGNQRSTKADLMRLRDEIGDRVREAAEKEGRVFAIMYDISGAPADQIQKILEVDWSHLLRRRALLDSSNYLREKGRPVVAIWGVGFARNQHDPAVIQRIVRNMRNMTPGGAYVVAGTPTHWQTMDGDADPNPAFHDVFYNEFDAISPWTVGRYRDQEGVDRFAAHKIRGDMQAIEQNCQRKKVDYIPVVWPGGSEHHISNRQREPNFAPRDGGKFLWRQIFNAKAQGARIIYGAMWDEYDEGTALMPIVPYKYNLPQEARFLALDADGYDLPSDWYMRICGLAAEGMRGERRIDETFPKKELDDYWSSRPKLTSKPVEASGSSLAYGSASGSSMTPGSNVLFGSATASGSTSGAEVVSASVAQDLLSTVEGPENDEAPPPYTLESSETVSDPPSQPSSASPNIQQSQQPISTGSFSAGQANSSPIAHLPQSVHSGASSAFQTGSSGVSSHTASSLKNTFPTSGAPANLQSHPSVGGSSIGPPVNLQSRPSVEGSSATGISQSYTPLVPLSARPAYEPQLVPKTDSEKQPVRQDPDYIANQGSFVGGFGEGRPLNIQSSRRVAEASSSFVDGFHQYQPTSYEPSSLYQIRDSSNQPAPPHVTYPSLNIFPTASSSTYPQTQFPPAEWQLEKPSQQSDQGYPPQHAYYGGPENAPKQPGYPDPQAHFKGSKMPSPPRHPSVASNHGASNSGPYLPNVGTPPFNNQPSPYGNSGWFSQPGQQEPSPHNSYFMQAQQPVSPPHSQSMYPPNQSSPPLLPPRPASANAAWGMVDMVAGKERRKKLEQGVDSVVGRNSQTVTQTYGAVVQSMDNVVQSGKKILNLYKVPSRK